MSEQKTQITYRTRVTVDAEFEYVLNGTKTWKMEKGLIDSLNTLVRAHLQRIPWIESTTISVISHISRTEKDR